MVLLEKFNLELALCVRDKDSERADVVWRALRESGTEPDKTSLELLLLTVTNRKDVGESLQVVEEAEQILNEIVREFGELPADATLVSLIGALSRAKRLDRI